MKLEVGMYVRGKYYSYRGKIGKIIKNYNNDLEIAYKNGVLKTTVGSFLEDNIDINGRQYVASFNIIDLIEVRDYVNGSPICLIKTDEKDRTRIYTDSNYKCGYLESDIKSIVTKEQFEQMSYRIEE